MKYLFYSWVEVKLLFGDVKTLIKKAIYLTKKSLAWTTAIGIAYLFIKLIFDLTT